MGNQLIQKEENLKGLLTNKVKALQSLLGDAEKAKRFMAAALQVGLNNDLAQCSEESIINAVMGVAMLDLNIDKNVGHAYLIKYGSTVQLQISYKGWLNLLKRAGYEIRTFPVFKCDKFEVSFNGWDYDFDLVPNFEERDLGKFDWEYENLKGILVVSKDKSDGEYKRDFYSREVIEKSRLSSPNQNPSKYDKPDIAKLKATKQPVGIWRDWYIDMCSKSAIKKFKNQLVIRDSYTPIANGIENAEFNKPIDYQKTVETGVIIEANVEPEEKEGFDINSLQKKKEEPEEKEVVAYDVLYAKLIKNGVSEDKAGQFLDSNESKLESYMNDSDLFENDAMDLLF